MATAPAGAAQAVTAPPGWMEAAAHEGVKRAAWDWWLGAVAGHSFGRSAFAVSRPPAPPPWLGSPRLRAAQRSLPGGDAMFHDHLKSLRRTSTPRLAWPRWSRRSPGRRLTEGRAVLSAVAWASTPGGAGDAATSSHTCVSCAGRHVITRSGGAWVRQKYRRCGRGPVGLWLRSCRPRSRYRSETEATAPPPLSVNVARFNASARRAMAAAPGAPPRVRPPRGARRGRRTGVRRVARRSGGRRRSCSTGR
jgi:hypothetical protein